MVATLGKVSPTQYKAFSFFMYAPQAVVRKAGSRLFLSHTEGHMRTATRWRGLTQAMSGHVFSLESSYS